MMNYQPAQAPSLRAHMVSRRGLAWHTLCLFVLAMVVAWCSTLAQARVVDGDREVPEDVGSGGGGVACVILHTRPFGVGRALAPLPCPVAAPPIYNLIPLPSLPGIGTQPLLLDLSTNQGPTMLACLLATVKSQFGADAVYLGESANGVAKFSVGGRIISFYALQASTDSSLGNNVVITGSNVLTVGTSCGRFTIAPALGNLMDFGAVVNGFGLQANIDSLGLTTIVVGTTVYVFRPDYTVTIGGTPGTPQLKQGADGLYRFTDSAGNLQILYPAFADPAGLGTMVQTILSQNGSVAIQADGTALFTNIMSQQFVLTPDLALTMPPAANAGQLWWQDATNHYFFRSSLLEQAQGFSVRQR